MAKALLGYIGSPEGRTSGETRMLRRRVYELEAQVLRLQAENDALNAAVHDDELLTIADADYQPALG